MDDILDLVKQDPLLLALCKILYPLKRPEAQPIWKDKVGWVNGLSD